MSDEVRKAGDYIIKQSMKIGGREVVLGENMEDKDGRFYFVADFESNEIFDRYTNAFVSNDYVEMVGMFAERITEEIEKLKHNRSDLSMDVITKDACIYIAYYDEKGRLKNVSTKDGIMDFGKYDSETYTSEEIKVEEDIKSVKSFIWVPVEP